MAPLSFGIEVETDVIEEEADDPNFRGKSNPAQKILDAGDKGIEKLENEVIRSVSKMVKKRVQKGRYHGGYTLLCSFGVDSPEDLKKVQKALHKNMLSSGNDQIATGVDYTITMGFEYRLTPGSKVYDYDDWDEIFEEDDMKRAATKKPRRRTASKRKASLSRDEQKMLQKAMEALKHDWEANPTFAASPRGGGGDFSQWIRKDFGEFTDQLDDQLQSDHRDMEIDSDTGMVDLASMPMREYLAAAKKMASKRKATRIAFSPEVKAYRASKNWDGKLLGMKDGQKLLLGEGEDRDGDHIYIHAHFTAETAQYDLGGRDPDSGDWYIFASESRSGGGRTWGEKSYRYTEGRRNSVAEMAANHARKLFGVPRRMLASDTTTDRQLLIRLASSMEKGSEERKAILAGLKSAAFAMDENDYFAAAKTIREAILEISEILDETYDSDLINGFYKLLRKHERSSTGHPFKLAGMAVDSDDYFKMVGEVGAFFKELDRLMDAAYFDGDERDEVEKIIHGLSRQYRMASTKTGRE